MVPISKDKRAAACVELDKGTKPAAVACEYGVSLSTIYRWRQEEHRAREMKKPGMKVMLPETYECRLNARYPGIVARLDNGEPIRSIAIRYKRSVSFVWQVLYRVRSKRKHFGVRL